ncbi:MAG: radical SAM protein [Firmicutes bacterium]|nr:radical SAM protein [Bacillota bacterium]
MQNHYFNQEIDNGLRYIKTSPRQQITDFNSIPIPDRSSVNYDKYASYPNEAMVTYCISLQGTRGCPYNCIFCHKIWPKNHIFRSAENIIEEIKIYYEMGIKRFAFIDDIFNLNQENSTRFFESIIKSGMKIDIFFPNGTRGDIMTKDYIDLMVEAGTVYIPMALETASPRLQKLIKKNLNLEKLHENITYLCEKYPQVISSLFFMVGFPTETEEEALMTIDFVKNIKWLHFPELHAVTIYPGTEIAKLVLENGISKDTISKNESKGFHELPETLPFADKTFVPRLRTFFLKQYWLNKERLLKVLPGEMKLMTESEIVRLYNSFLQVGFRELPDLLKFFRITQEELGINTCLDEAAIQISNLHEKMKNHFHQIEPEPESLKILLLDVTHFFSSGQTNVFTAFVEPPLGLMYLVSYLKKRFGSQVNYRIAKSFIDFDSYKELQEIINDFKPDFIGLRCLTFHKKFLHETIGKIREWGINVPIIVGGPHATSAYEEILLDNNVDLVVIGEGEVTLGELVEKSLVNGRKLPQDDVLREISGIAFVPKEKKAV